MQETNAANRSRQEKSLSPYLLWLIWIIWLPFITTAIVSQYQAHPPLLRLLTTYVGLILFFSIYLRATWRNAVNLLAKSPSVQPEASTWLPIAALVALSCVLAWLGNSYGWLSLFIFTSAYIAGCLPTLWAALAVAALALLTIVIGIVTDPSTYDIGQGLTFVVVVGIVTISLVRSFATSRELRIAREEIARLAVMTERLRIARDLHDLLGHNLSLITLKSELAGRLIDVAPKRAIVEIRDVENVARTTLQEVREAVAGYRQPTLDSELHGAQEILAAAGIAYRHEGDESVSGNLPSMVEAILAWAVREGVTNVIRHSRARHCTIRLISDSHCTNVEVINDGDKGTLAPVENINSRSSGLRGLTERVNALGGVCEAGPRADGGFRLVVSVPRTPMTPEAEQSSAPLDLQAPQVSETYGEQPEVYAERSEQE